MITEITSAQNAKVKRIKDLLKAAKSRRKEGVFVAEGRRLVVEVPVDIAKEVWICESLYGKLSEDPAANVSGEKVRENDGKYDENLKNWMDAVAVASVPVYVVPDSLYEGMSDTVTPQGVLCVVGMLTKAADEVSASQNSGGRSVLILLEDLQDPGNMGTIFRTAEAAGVTGIIMDKTCVDIYNPKVVRSAMGSIFRMPFAVCDDMTDQVVELGKIGFKTLASDLNSASDFRKADYSGDVAIVIGNEGSGIKKSTSEAASARVFIPMEGQIESLNAGVAAALLMYEATR